MHVCTYTTQTNIPETKVSKTILTLSNCNALWNISKYIVKEPIPSCRASHLNNYNSGYFITIKARLVGNIEISHTSWHSWHHNILADYAVNHNMQWGQETHFLRWPCHQANPGNYLWAAQAKLGLRDRRLRTYLHHV